MHEPFKVLKRFFVCLIHDWLGYTWRKKQSGSTCLEIFYYPVQWEMGNLLFLKHVKTMFTTIRKLYISQSKGFTKHQKKKYTNLTSKTDRAWGFSTAEIFCMFSYVNMLPSVMGKNCCTMYCWTIGNEVYYILVLTKLMILYFVFYRTKAEDYCATKRWAKNGAAKIRREQKEPEN